MRSLPIAPIFIANSVSLAVSREKDGKLRLVYAGWDDAKVVEPSEVLELRASLGVPASVGARADEVIE